MGLSVAQHERIFARVCELMWTEEHELLPAHRYLLHEDFAVLGEGSARIQQVWIKHMESVLRAAERVRTGLIVPGSLQRFLRPRLRPRLTRRCPASGGRGSLLPTSLGRASSRWQQQQHILRPQHWSSIENVSNVHSVVQQRTGVT